MIRVFVHTETGLRSYEAENIVVERQASGSLFLTGDDGRLEAKFPQGQWNWYERRVIDEEKK